MRFELREESQGVVVWQAAIYVGGRKEIVPAQSETGEQPIDVRDAKLIDYPLGAFLLEHRRVRFHPQIDSHSHPSSCFVPRSSSRARRRASVFSCAFRVPSGMERLSASTSLATVEKIGPSSEASEASAASCSRRLIVLSGIGQVPNPLSRAAPS